MTELGDSNQPRSPPPPYTDDTPDNQINNIQRPIGAFNTHFEDLSSGDEDIELENVSRDNSEVHPVILSGVKSTSTKDLTSQHNSLKELGLKRLSPFQHLMVAMCRDASLFLILKNLVVLWTKWYCMITSPTDNTSWTAVWATEFFLAGVWCIVAALLSYSILDGLMARWLVMYTIQAVMVRILSMSLLIIVLIELLNYMFNNSANEFCLAAWIIISCVLTFIFIVQNYVTSNLRLNEILLNNTKDQECIDDIGVSSDTNTGETLSSLHRRIDQTSSAGVMNPKLNINKQKDENGEKPHRTVDLYNLTVFGVVPIGVASFVTMCGLVRLVVILRVDIGLKITQLLPPGTIST